MVAPPVSSPERAACCMPSHWLQTLVLVTRVCFYAGHMYGHSLPLVQMHSLFNCQLPRPNRPRLAAIYGSKRASRARVWGLTVFTIQKMAVKKARTAAGEESRYSGRDEVIYKLRGVQAELDKINAKAHEKWMEIEHKYKKIRDPVYARRDNIISDIPGLWLTSFLYHPVLGNMLTKYDEKILGYLDSLSVEDFPDPRKGYCITFSFKPNRYFRNRELTKTIEVSDDGTLRSIGTVILWKRGKRPLGKRNNKRSGNKRLLSKQSFCYWISNPSVDTHQDMFAEIIKHELWPDPLEPFNIEEDDYDDDFEDDEDEGDGRGDIA